MRDQLTAILCTGILGICGYMDKKSRLVWMPLVIGGFLLRIPLFLLDGKWSAGWMSGLIPGIFLLLVARITDESIGYGDGLVVLLCGWYLGMVETVFLLLVSLAFCAVCSLWLIAVRHVSRGYRIAYLPFLFAADVCLLIVRGGCG